MNVKVHVFSNGNVIFEFEKNVRSDEIEYFREMYMKGGRGALFFQGLNLMIVEHMNPLLVPLVDQGHVDQGQQD